MEIKKIIKDIGKDFLLFITIFSIMLFLINFVSADIRGVTFELKAGNVTNGNISGGVTNGYFPMATGNNILSNSPIKYVDGFGYTGVIIPQNRYLSIYQTSDGLHFTKFWFYNGHMNFLNDDTGEIEADITTGNDKIVTLSVANLWNFTNNISTNCINYHDGTTQCSASSGAYNSTYEATTNQWNGNYSTIIRTNANASLKSLNVTGNLNATGNISSSEYIYSRRFKGGTGSFYPSSGYVTADVAEFFGGITRMTPRTGDAQADVFVATDAAITYSTIFSMQSGYSNIRTNAAKPLYILTNDADGIITGGLWQLALMTNGNVGIGTNATTQKLTVNGNVNATKYYGNGSELTSVNASFANIANTATYSTSSGSATSADECTIAYGVNMGGGTQGYACINCDGDLFISATACSVDAC